MFLTFKSITLALRAGLWGEEKGLFLKQTSLEKTDLGKLNSLFKFDIPKIKISKLQIACNTRRSNTANST